MNEEEDYKKSADIAISRMQRLIEAFLHDFFGLIVFIFSKVTRRKYV